MRDGYAPQSPHLGSPSFFLRRRVGWGTPRNKGLLVLGVIYFLALVTIFKPWVHGIDGAGYYAWLRSVVIDRDLDTYNEFRHYEEAQDEELQSTVWRNFFRRTETGLWSNHYPVGSAVLWSPFFLLAHALTRLLNLAGYGLASDGYSSLYVAFSTFGSTVTAFVGLVLIYRIAEELYGEFTATLATASIWLASPLVFYMYMHPSMSHANDAFVNALFVWVWYATRRARAGKGWLALGLTGGLAALVRTQNALLMAFPGLELLAEFIASLRRRSVINALRSVGKGCLFAVAFLVAFVPQMLVWKAVFGSYIVLNPQQVSSGYGFNLWSPNFLNALFSSNHGLFIWNPLLLPATLGVWLLVGRERRLALLLAMAFLLQLYVIGSWVAWHGTVAFGARFFVNSVPMFTLGLAALVDRLRRRISATVLSAAGAVFIAWNFLLIIQYALQLIPRAGPVSIAQMVSNQFTAVPRSLSKVLELLTARFSR